MKNLPRIIIAMCILILSASACSSNNNPNPEATAAPSVAVLPTQSPSTVTPGAIAATPAPVVAEDFILPQEGVRPIAVMIDNEGTRSLPQGGLNKAQIVYEVIVEGGETRLMPVFWGTRPGMIGPVRSSRDYFLDYSMEHDAIYVHFGWSPQAKADIPKLKISNINGLYVGNDVFWDLTKDKGNWQDSYTSMEKLLNYAGEIKYKTTTDAKLLLGYNRSDAIPANGISASKVSLRYSASNISSYEYDSTKGLYMRFRKGKPHMERVSERQLEVKNILIQFTPNYDIKGDNKGRQEMNTTGKGKGWFITEGKAMEIKWSKESRRAQTKYTDKDGNPILLNQGQTWIQIMPLNAKVSMK